MLDSSGATSASSVAVPSPSWDVLKKQARRLESQAYTKLAEFSRASASFASSVNAALSMNSTSSSSNLSSSLSLSSSSAAESPPTLHQILAEAETYHSLDTDINSLLSQLTHTTEDMARILEADSAAAATTPSLASLSSTPSSSSEANNYTLQRFRAILHDYTVEFNRTRESIAANKQRAELLLPSSSSANYSNSELSGLLGNASSSSSLRPRTEQLVREKNALHASLRMTEDLLSSSISSRDSLYSQSALFGAMRTRVTGLRNRFPLVHSLMSLIERQKKKDLIVIASVIAFCICFTILYIANKRR